MEYKDYYSILGVERKADQDTIKRAYRKLARKYHPDVSSEANAEEQFKNVQEAYEVLKDPEKRTAYDSLGSNWQAGQDFRAPPGWDGEAHFHQSGGGHQQFSEEDMAGFSDFFSDLFGGRGARAQGFAGAHGRARQFKQRGTDQRAKVQITLEEAFKGTSRNLQLQMPEMDASGQVQQKVRTLKVNIPAGAAQGQQLRLANQGGQGVGGMPNGDLYLEIDIQPHKFYTVQGKDIYMKLPVTPWEAALGSDIRIPTLGGPVGMKVAAGAQSGQKLRLKGRGMPSKRGAGDQYVVLEIQTPAAHSEEQTQLYKDMAEKMPFNPRKDWTV